MKLNSSLYCPSMKLPESAQALSMSQYDIPARSVQVLQLKQLRCAGNRSTLQLCRWGLATPHKRHACILLGLITLRGEAMGQKSGCLAIGCAKPWASDPSARWNAATFLRSGFVQLLLHGRLRNLIVISDLHCTGKSSGAYYHWAQGGHQNLEQEKASRAWHGGQRFA